MQCSMLLFGVSDCSDSACCSGCSGCFGYSGSACYFDSAGSDSYSDCYSS